MNRDEINGLIYTLDLLFPLILTTAKTQTPNIENTCLTEDIDVCCLFGTNCIAFRQPRRHFTYSQKYDIRYTSSRLQRRHGMSFLI